MTTGERRKGRAEDELADGEGRRCWAAESDREASDYRRIQTTSWVSLGEQELESGTRTSRSSRCLTGRRPQTER